MVVTDGGETGGQLNGAELTTVTDLKESGFGRPRPRHGLPLVYWFSSECVTFLDQQGAMEARCDVETGDFGFHRFNNFEGILRPKRHEWLHLTFKYDVVPLLLAYCDTLPSP